MKKKNLLSKSSGGGVKSSMLPRVRAILLRMQVAGDKDGRRIWAFDLPPRAGSRDAPKRWLVATPAEFDAAYACVPAGRSSGKLGSTAREHSSG